MADYVSAMEGTNVVKTVFLETDAAKDHLELEASFVGKLCADPSVPVAGAVIGCSLDDSAGFKEYIDKMRVESYIKGVRDVLLRIRSLALCTPETLTELEDAARYMQFDKLENLEELETLTRVSGARAGGIDSGELMGDQE